MPLRFHCNILSCSGIEGVNDDDNDDDDNDDDDNLAAL